MTDVAQSPVVFDPLEPGFVEWPYDQYARLRTHDPVHRSETLHAWVLTRYHDINRVLRDSTISVEIENATMTPVLEAEVERRHQNRRGAETLVLKDDPDHGRLRKLMMGPFRPKAIDDLRGLIEDRVRVALDALVGRTEIDLISDFAYPLPVEIFCHMLGVPEEDHPKFRWWTQCVARSLDPLMGEEERDECMVGVDEMRDYLEVQSELKRQNPSDDLMSMLVHAEEDGQVMSHEELQAQLITLYVAGHEPIAGLIGTGLLALLNHPEQLRMLRARPEFLRDAVSELLRYDGPNQFVRRITTEPMEFDEATIPAGAVIYASPGSGNRDPVRWGETVDEVDITRSDAGQHIQFGGGVHTCLGSHLARLQAEVAFAAIFERLDGLDLAGEPEWNTRMVIRGLDRFPITCKVR